MELTVWYLVCVLQFCGVRGWGIAQNRAQEEDQVFKIIFPGTKWCGSGSVAADDNDLGTYPETDACCREHDLCPDLIESQKTKYGLTNYAPYTRLHCDCDEKFLKCLRNSTDDMKVSQTVGVLYFDVLRTKCYKQEHTVIGCKKYNNIAMRCEEYDIDPDSPTSYQWFDVPVFHLS